MNGHQVSLLTRLILTKHLVEDNQPHNENHIPILNIDQDEQLNNNEDPIPDNVNDNELKNKNGI